MDFDGILMLQLETNFKILEKSINIPYLAWNQAGDLFVMDQQVKHEWLVLRMEVRTETSA